MARVLITHPIPDKAADLLRKAGHEVTIRPLDTALSAAELQEAVTTYDALITLLTDPLKADVLFAAGPQLKIIANYAVGYDNIDVTAAAKRGIVVANTPDVLTSAVAEHTVALLVTVARRIVEADHFMRSGQFTGWQPTLFLGTELNGKTLGIVGAGRIGRDVAQRAHHGFGMKIIYHDIRQDADFERQFAAEYAPDIDNLLPLVDALTLHVPLLPATQHLINKERLARMKPTAFVINTARGPVIDEAALTEALRNKQLAGAGLDVFEHEPAMAAGLGELSTVVVTPHIASATVETRSAMAALAAQNILAVLAGKPPLTPVAA